MTDSAHSSGDKAERIAKRIARAGVASRREAERLIDAGRVTVNGEVIRTPALDVGPEDQITIDGTPLPKPERARLWRYHQPPGLLVSRNDPHGRRTIYMELPPELAHAISVGRLDFNSEGLLLLTNDGELSRRLELPTEGLVRRYRARAFGHIDQKALDRLKRGITVEGVRYGPIQATLEEARGANAWIALSLTEGKNREVRNVLAALGLKVNRLIRTQYGPFALGDMPPGAVAEVPAASLMRDLGVATERPKGWAKAKPKLKQRPGKNARLASRKPMGEQDRDHASADRREPRREHRPGDRRPSGNLHRTRSSKFGADRRDADRAPTGRKGEDRPSAPRIDRAATRSGSGRGDAERPEAKRAFSERRGQQAGDRPDAVRNNAGPRFGGRDERARSGGAGSPGPGAKRGDARRFAERRDDRPGSDRPNAMRREGDSRSTGTRVERMPTGRSGPEGQGVKRDDNRRFAKGPDRRGDRPQAKAEGGRDRQRPDANRPRSDRPNSDRQAPRGPRRGPHADRRR